jgi:hypothetical protein
LVLGGCLENGEERPAADLDRLASRLGSELASVRPERLDRVVEAGDERYVAPLIELLRATQVGFAEYTDRDRIVQALEELSGKRFGSDWPSWVEWYAESEELEPPPGFRAWKGRLLGAIDPDFERFFDAKHPSRIRVEEVVWGGVLLDGIPALDRPRTVAAGEAEYLDSDDPVFGVELNGDARAYPLRIMDWHEMANDVVGGVPVSLAYCTLCGAGVLYETRTRDRTYTFGSSGFLMRSNKLMYDRQTHTLWNHLTGEPVLGPLADERIDLKVRPVVVTTWDEWRRRHPSTRVLDVDTGFDRPYEKGAAYADYFASDDALFPVRDPGRGLRSKQRVFALRVGRAAKAYPLDRILPRHVVNDELGGSRLVVVATGRRILTRGVDQQSGLAATYESGAEVRAYLRGGHSFDRALRDERGRRWRLTEDALVGPRGERLGRLGGHLAYAFGWLSYFPRTEIYGEG